MYVFNQKTYFEFYVYKLLKYFYFIFLNTYLAEKIDVFENRLKTLKLENKFRGSNSYQL